MVSVEKLLTIDYLSEIKLLTDRKTIEHQEVSNVEITETPDVEFYISPETLILTTGMIFKDDQLQMIPFIDSLIRAKGVGLAIKSGRFLNGELHPKVIDYANQRNFPIINIPDKYPLGRLLHQISNYIWNQRKEEIEFALSIQKQFSDLLLNNTSIDKVINEFSKIIKCPIILLSPIKKVVSYSHHFTKKPLLIQSLQEQFQKRFKQKQVPNDYFKMKDENDQTLLISASSVFVFKYFPHYLLILNPENMTYPISAFTIDQAKLVLSYILYKTEKVFSSYLHTSSSFMLETMGGDTLNKGILYKTIEEIKYVDSNYYLAVEVNVSSALEPKLKTVKLYEKYALILDFLKIYGQEYFKDMFLFQTDANAHLYLILQNHVGNLDEKLMQCHDDLLKLVNIDMIFSVGESVSSIDQVSRSIDQASLAFKARLTDYNKETISYYNNSGVQHLFHDIDSKDINYFCESVLKELAYPQTNNLKELRETLKVYLDNQCETTLTANILFVHRNTVKYRIEKCQELLGVDVTDPRASLNIRIALMLSV
ncbi:PucR family transcriptional regulator [Facklamia sp. P12945]|uniref:PucR family transcriptional regulator n=1 Tax=unclassified Facklamia TaxID=2622293 RepID=UPI003D17EEFA